MPIPYHYHYCDEILLHQKMQDDDGDDNDDDDNNKNDWFDVSFDDQETKASKEKRCINSDSDFEPNDDDESTSGSQGGD